MALGDVIIEAPLNPGYSSLNLAQAVLLVAHEWYSAADETPPERLGIRDSKPATKDDLQRLFDHLETELTDCGFLRNEEKKPGMIRNLRNIFVRAALTEQEIRTLHGVIKELRWGRREDRRRDTGRGWADARRHKGGEGEAPPEFGQSFRDELRTLIAWRRDVRRFRTDPIDETTVRDLLAQTCLSPSVGNSQPWRFVVVEDPAKRTAVRENFKLCNAEAAKGFSGDKAALYHRLKLEGLDRAPVQIAVFADTHTGAGAGLGSRTMPETLCHSTAAAIQTLALAARAKGIGVGQVTILDPAEVTRVLEVDPDWTFVSYLCVGYPEEEHKTPELVRIGWQERVDLDEVVVRR